MVWVLVDMYTGRICAILIVVKSTICGQKFPTTFNSSSVLKIAGP